jgi:hypothetical protein
VLLNDQVIARAEKCERIAGLNATARGPGRVYCRRWERIFPGKEDHPTGPGAILGIPFQQPPVTRSWIVNLANNLFDRPL